MLQIQIDDNYRNRYEGCHMWTELLQLRKIILFNVFNETKSGTMNIFRFFYFLFKSFVKVEFSHVFTINLFTIAENCTEK